jgi:hypothetical protein
MRAISPCTCVLAPFIIHFVRNASPNPLITKAKTKAIQCLSSDSVFFLHTSLLLDSHLVGSEINYSGIIFLLHFITTIAS